MNKVICQWLGLNDTRKLLTFPKHFSLDGWFSGFPKHFFLAGLSAWPARLARSSHRRLMRHHLGLMGWHQHGQTRLQTRRKDQGTRRPRLLVLEEGERLSSLQTSRQITRSRRQRVVGARSSTYARRRCVIEQHGLGYASAIE
jgi:hypothetical protein